MPGLPGPDRIGAVLFDLDDTLVDVRGAWRASFAEAIAPIHAATPSLRALGAPEAIYDGAFRRYAEEAHAGAGGGEWEERFTTGAFARLLAESGRPDPALAARLADGYRAAVPGRIALYPDALATLDAVGARWPLALVTNGPPHLQRPTIERFGLERRFAAVVVSGEAGVRKPDPAIFAIALGALGVAPGAAVHAGDNPRDDVAGAIAAGLYAILVDRGGWPTPSPGAPAPHAEVRALGELPGLMGIG